MPKEKKKKETNNFNLAPDFEFPGDKDKKPTDFDKPSD